MRHGRYLFVLALLLSSLLGCSPSQPQGVLSSVYINEVMTAGDGDWIELYNSDSLPVTLTDCFFSDDTDTVGKWRFPTVTLQAGEYLLLYADDTPLTEQKDGCHLPFRLSAAGETLVFSDSKGQAIQTLSVPESLVGISYGRETNTSSYAWYASPTPGTANETGMVLGQQSYVRENGLYISEYMTRNHSTLYDQQGDYPDWIEIHNFSDDDKDLSGYLLTDSRKTLKKWEFPQGTLLPAGGYLLVFCSEKAPITDSKELHADFLLGGDDSFLGLYTPDGIFCSGLTLTQGEQDISYGITNEGTYRPCRYPTPAYPNALENE